MKTTHENGLYIILYLFGFVILAYCFFFTFIFEPLAKYELKKYVSKSTGNLLILNIENLKADALSSTIQAGNVRVEYNPDIIKDTIKYRHLPKVLYNLGIPYMRISGVNILRFVFVGNIDIDEIFIKNPDVQLVLNKHGMKSRVEKRNDSRTFKINSINISRGNLTISRIDAKKDLLNIPLFTVLLRNVNINNYDSVLVDKISEININVNNIESSINAKKPVINSANINISLINAGLKLDEMEFIPQIGDFNIALKNIEIDFDKFYKMKIPNILINKLNRGIEIDSAKLIPKYGNVKFGEVAGQQTTRTELKLKSIRIYNISYDSLIEAKKIIADKILIDRLSLDAFLDLRLMNVKTPAPDAPQKILRNLPYYVKIDTIEIKDSYVMHHVINDKGNAPGDIDFSDLNIKIFNVTNDSALIHNGNKIIADIRGYLVGKGKIKAHLVIPVISPNNSYTYSGSLGSLDGHELNKYLIKNEFIRIDNGMIDSAYFAINANDSNSKGILNFYYHDLKISLLNTAKESNIYQKKQIKSFLTNLLKIKSENKAGSDFRKGDIDYKRDFSQSLTSYWWKTLRQGLLKVIGAG